MKIINVLLSLLLVTNLLLSQGCEKDSNAIVKAEFVYNTADVTFPSCHASTIVETEDGLLVSWFAGTREKNPDVGIWVSKYKNGKWSIPVEAANGIQNKEKRFPTWNPVLFNTGTEIKLFYKVGPSPSTWWGEVISSTDNGNSWSSPVKLPKNIIGPIKNKPVKLSNGDLLSPSSSEDNGWRAHMERSLDMGKSWERTIALNDGKETSLIQPTILDHGNEKLQILCRSKNNAIYSSWSTDNGYNWNKFEAIGLPNPNSGFDAVTLNDGKFILIYNHIACKPGEKWGDRNIINLAISENGIEWKAGLLLEDDEDEDGEYSYPAVIQTKDGKIHITYTWNRTLIKHVVVDPSLIQSRNLINGNWPKE